jgi:hypothetical protein
VDHFGDLAPECATAYYKYGCALFWKAQQESDFLGGPVSKVKEQQAEKADPSGSELPPGFCAFCICPPILVLSRVGLFTKMKSVWSQGRSGAGGVFTFIDAAAMNDWRWYHRSKACGFAA